MTDMLATIAPKSNQLNADDLLGGRTLTIKVTKVSGVSGEQPIAINFEGDNGKPYYPCKSMRRVLVYVWGNKGQQYVGRSMTLYCDPAVKFGGLEVGGIRISHMSHLDKQIIIALTVSKSNRKPFTVKPLLPASQNAASPIPESVTFETALHDIQNAPTLEGLKFKFSQAIAGLKDQPQHTAALVAAKDKRKAELSEPEVPVNNPPEIQF